MQGFRTAVGFTLALAMAGCQPESKAKFQTYDELLSQEQEARPDTESSRASDAETVAGMDSPSAASPSSGLPGLRLDQIPDSVLRPAPEVAPGQNHQNDTKATTATELAELPEIPASAIAPLNVVDGATTSEIMKVADRVATKSTGPAALLPVATPTPQPGGIQLLVPKKEFRAEGSPSGLRVSYDDLDLLKVLNMEPVPEDAPRHFPGWLADLNGQTIRIRGFMYPTFESSGIEQFVLARDNQICCFGRDPKVYDLIAVTLKPNRTTNYIPNRPFDVVGTFRIDMLVEGGKPLGLYWLEDAQVIDR